MFKVTPAVISGTVALILLVNNQSLQAQVISDPNMGLSLGSATTIPNYPLANTAENGQILLAAIQKARSILQEQVDNQRTDPAYRPPIVYSKNIPLELVAAVWNSRNDDLALVRLLKNGYQLKPLNQDVDYTFKLERDNGVNSLIKITNRPELIVLGLIHPVFADISTPRQTRYRLENVVYIPYAEHLNNDFIVKAGEDYLNNKITAVYQELERLKVKSKAQPTKLLVEVIEPTIVKTIIAIEHVDSSILFNNEVSDYLRRFYATLAVNQHASYAYARSSASARGLVQFIPSTYESLRKIRPDLTLHADFVQGMTDPYNAVKAQIGLLDYNLTLLPEEIKNKYLNNPLTIGSYLAAMYNGGPARVRRAIARWGEDWHSYHGNISTSLKRETAYYVAKYKLVFEQLNQKSLYLASRSLP